MVIVGIAAWDELTKRKIHHDESILLDTKIKFIQFLSTFVIIALRNARNTFIYIILLFFLLYNHPQMLIKRRRTMIYMATRRVQLWNIVVVAVVSCYSCLYTIDTYFSNNREWQSRRQQQRIISNEDSQIQIHLFRHDALFQSSHGVNPRVGDVGPVRTNVLPEIEPFPRWEGFHWFR